MVICFPQIRNIPSVYNKLLTGFGSFTATKYGTRCLAHEYGTTPKVEIIQIMNHSYTISKLPLLLLGLPQSGADPGFRRGGVSLG